MLVEEIGFSNAPGAPEALYGRAFFPLPDDVSVSEGEAVRVDFGASFAAGDFVYRWAVKVGGESEQPRKQFRQSTFAGVPLSGRALEAVESRTPVLGPRGRLARSALNLWTENGRCPRSPRDWSRRRDRTRRQSRSSPLWP